MVLPLIVGLGKSLATKKTRKTAQNKIKKVAQSKLKTAAVEKSKSKLKSNNFDNSNNTSFSPKVKISTSNFSIKSAPSTKSQIVQLKVNVTNIHNFLKQQNKSSKKLQKENKKIVGRYESKKKLNLEESKFKFSKITNKSKNIFKSIASSGNILNNILEFMGLLLLGILTNAIPAIISFVQDVIDNVTAFLRPIKSGFALIKGFFEGNIDEPQYDDDKKEVNNILDLLEKDGGIVDQLANKMGPFGVIIKKLKEYIPMLKDHLNKTKNTGSVQAKKDGQEGFLDKETKIWTKKEWTEEERDLWDLKAEVNSQNVSSSGGSGEMISGVPGGTDGNKVSGFPINSHYGQRWGRLHGGIDVATPTGTPLAISGAGKIMYGGLHSSGYGNMIDAWVPALGVQFRFAHLSKIFKRTGDTFKSGEILGLTGGGKGDPGKGSSTGPHLHYEIDRTKGGTTYGGARDKGLLYRMAASVLLGSKKGNGGGEGGYLPTIKGNLPENENFALMLEPQISENVSTYYYVQPYTTIQTEVIPFTVTQNKSLSVKSESNSNILWKA